MNCKIMMKPKEYITSITEELTRITEPELMPSD